MLLEFMNFLRLFEEKYQAIGDKQIDPEMLHETAYQQIEYQLDYIRGFNEEDTVKLNLL